MNELEKQREQLNRAHNVFRQQVAAGNVNALDRFGKKIEPGDLLMLRTDVDLLFTVLEVGPSLDRNGPPGLMNVKLTATFELKTQGGIPYRQAHIYGRQALSAEPPGSNGQPADPASDGASESRPNLSVVPPADEPPT
jgi:hypothetical protein